MFNIFKKSQGDPSLKNKYSLCTFLKTGENYGIQDCYECFTCGLKDGEGCCEYCALRCHAGHDVRLKKKNAKFYCDCPSTSKCVSLTPLINADDLCTFFHTGKTLVKQPKFNCETCDLAGNRGCCAVCVVNCHRGHTVTLDSYSTDFYCDCAARVDCTCSIPRARGSVCTYTVTGTNYAPQPWYKCITCDLVGNNGCCSVCAATCHSGHEVYLYESKANFYCDCGAERTCRSLAPAVSRTSLCTFAKSGRDYLKQPWYYCITCDLVGDKGCCAVCAATCHEGHKLKLHKPNSGFFCDCGAERSCKSLFPRVTNSSLCTYTETGTDYIQQSWYQCITCDLVENTGCCAVCAYTCHAGHEVVLKETNSSFYCDCGHGLKGKCSALAPRRENRPPSDVTCLPELTNNINYTTTSSSSNNENNNLDCSICLERTKSILFEPCMHLSTCDSCSTYVETCPVCRTVIQRRLKVFIT
eukprot:TRINITY_DN5775_c0_g1_i1.p1 TRINITY_DN5775_c0_g1~~TRINITY_DN5775_c0_g1_i1.p1  ORF type:complete len:470 (+),score=21.03 TRINITY_DN5775_c0_g1_i1:1-1410(+)